MILQSHNLSLSFRSISLLYPMLLFFIYLLYSPFSSSFHSLNFLLSHSSCSYTSFAFDKKILFEEGRKIKLYQLSCSQLIFDMLTNIIHDMKRGHSFLDVVTNISLIFDSDNKVGMGFRTFFGANNWCWDTCVTSKGKV